MAALRRTNRLVNVFLNQNAAQLGVEGYSKEASDDEEEEAEDADFENAPLPAGSGAHPPSGDGGDVHTPPRRLSAKTSLT